ncbi:ATP-dependent translocase ABCB1-like isoform X2 [Lineus longissimus]|uniref:ATP-dependent translocase ABCB1-like isoform X2 n=1 Tax=Lineus longissimus TaxID=88925 RepID=UPI00315C8296
MGDTITEPPPLENVLSSGQNYHGDEINLEDISDTLLMDDNAEIDGVGEGNLIISMPNNLTDDLSEDLPPYTPGDRYITDNTSVNSDDTANGKVNGDLKVNGTVNGDVDVNLSVNGKVDFDPDVDSAKKDDGGDDGDDSGSKKDEKEKVEIKKVGVLELFRFHDKLDILLMFLGALGSVGQGAAFPLNLLIYGQVADFFVGDQMMKNNATTAQNYTVNMYSLISPFCVYFVYVGIGTLVMSYLSIAFWMWTAERQTKTIRRLFFHSILKQEISWFDTHQIGELNSRLADDLNTIHDGIGDKVAQFLQGITTFIAAFVLGFAKNWELALIMLSLVPFVGITAFVMTRLLQGFTQKELKAYAKAGAVAEEVLGAIRTVVAFGGEKKESDRYNENLTEAKKMGIKKGISVGLGQGVIWFVIFSSFALAFWYGAKMIREARTTAGVILQVFFGVLIGAMAIGNALPHLEGFTNARAAAASIYEIIDQVPSIDSSSDEGEKPEIVGNVEFDDIHFRYPARPDQKIMHGFGVSVSVGQTVAFVGPSGCGKSTTMQLLQRFYDPEDGVVRIDGHDIRDMNVKWLRRHIGIVSQEPILFATTIVENIRYGRNDVTQAEIEQATREANAYNFIKDLPDGFETLVGERGAQLSGGQKQRIAIARALVRNPKILLLDEATSALDTASESAVQEALEKASRGRTTIVIAHRLSTVRDADVIFGIKDGQVVEQGNHDALMVKEGLYFNLVTSQIREESKDAEAADDFDDEDSIQLKRGLSRQSSHFKRQGSSNKFGQRGSLRRLNSAVSESGDEEEADAKEVQEEDVPEVSIKRVWAMNASEWLFIMIGCISAIFTGGVQPAFAVVFSEILGVFAIVDMDLQAQQSQLFAIILVSIGATVAICHFLQSYFFTLSGEQLTERLRHLTFKAMLRQEVGWFDLHENQVGALCVRLASDTSLVKGATGNRVGTIIQSIANLGTGVVIAFVFGWKLTLVVLCFMPLLAVGGFLQVRLLHGYAKGDKKKMEEGGKIATEAIENVRTVATLVQEVKFEEIYNNHSEAVFLAGTKRAHVYGIAYAFTQSIIYFAYAAAFAFGAFLIDEGEMNFIDIFKIFSAITFGGMAFGRASSMAPDYTKAKISAAKIFQLLDREPVIDAYSTNGETVSDSDFKGEVSFGEVEFTYPTRPGTQILRGLTVSISPGQTLGLVGTSGCGKSTTVQLAERFYDPFGGSVTVDGKEIRSLNLQWYRSKLGIVAQEPVLFDASIAQNIAYGDNTRKIHMDEIIEAARKANIHSFIQNLPDGYETNVGDKGTQLSGGQKQRVAIARALIRKPKILLLDEATSALDMESEKVVQEALDKAKEGPFATRCGVTLTSIFNNARVNF